jgi:tRNA(adenine34) deaminase
MCGVKIVQLQHEFSWPFDSSGWRLVCLSCYHCFSGVGRLVGWVKSTVLPPRCLIATWCSLGALVGICAMSDAETDLRMMRRCVELAAMAAKERELPFSCVICRDGEIIAEAGNRVIRDGDVTRHAELMAISEAQRSLGRNDLSDCAIYSSVEPCAMCSFAIRETRIGRVVFAISSPMMGGYSKWNVLSDNELSNIMPEVFGGVPEVTAGLMYREVAAVWRNWNPIIWLAIRFRGCLTDASKEETCRQLQARSQKRLGSLRRMLASHFQRLTGAQRRDAS